MKSVGFLRQPETKFLSTHANLSQYKCAEPKLLWAQARTRYGKWSKVPAVSPDVRYCSTAYGVVCPSLLLPALFDPASRTR